MSPITGPTAAIITYHTECPECFGTGILKPTREATTGCPRGCGVRLGDAPGQRFAGVRHPQVLVEGPEHEVAWVDEGIAELVTLLWHAGVLTYISCQGYTADESPNGEERLPYVAIADLAKLARCITVIESLGCMVESVFHRLANGNLPEDYFIEFIPQTSAFRPHSVGDVAVRGTDGAENGSGDGERRDADQAVVSRLNSLDVAEHQVTTTSP